MRFASCLFVGVALLLVASVAVTSLRHREAAAAAPLSRIVSEGNTPAVRRLEAKTSVTHRLLDGELTLLEAAAWFRSINRMTGAPACVVLPGEEDKSETERLCRQVIRWADATTRTTSADLAKTVTHRLETELEEALRRDGGVELPDQP